MNRIELEGVLAHELSHIKNYDILVSTLAVTLVGVVALLADFGLRFLWWGGGRRNDNDRDGGGADADPRHRRLRAAASSRRSSPRSCSSRSAGAARRWPTSPASR